MNTLASQVYNRLVDAMIRAQTATHEMRQACDEFERAHKRFCELLEFPSPVPIAEVRKMKAASTRNTDGPKAAA